MICLESYLYLLSIHRDATYTRTLEVVLEGGRESAGRGAASEGPGGMPAGTGRPPLPPVARGVPPRRAHRSPRRTRSTKASTAARPTGSSAAKRVSICRVSASSTCAAGICIEGRLDGGIRLARGKPAGTAAIHRLPARQVGGRDQDLPPQAPDR